MRIKDSINGDQLHKTQAHDAQAPGLGCCEERAPHIHPLFHLIGIPSTFLCVFLLFQTSAFASCPRHCASQWIASKLQQLVSISNVGCVNAHGDLGLLPMYHLCGTSEEGVPSQGSHSSHSGGNSHCYQVTTPLIAEGPLKLAAGSVDLPKLKPTHLFLRTVLLARSLWNGQNQFSDQQGVVSHSSLGWHLSSLEGQNLVAFVAPKHGPPAFI